MTNCSRAIAKIPGFDHSASIHLRWTPVRHQVRTKYLRFPVTAFASARPRIMP